jgi:hypothetical protein
MFSTSKPPVRTTSVPLNSADAAKRGEGDREGVSSVHTSVVISKIHVSFRKTFDLKLPEEMRRVEVGISNPAVRQT